jgi:hypothetical protein
MNLTPRFLMLEVFPFVAELAAGGSSVEFPVS